MAKKTLTYKIYDQTRGTDPDAKERGIRSDTDWRDADRVLILDGARVRSTDTAFEAHQKAVEPDWSEFDTILQWNDNSHQPVNLGREPAPIFKDALLNGLVLYGVLIARDEQRHG